MNVQQGIQNTAQLLQIANSTIPTIGALLDDKRGVEEIKVIMANDLRYRNAPNALPLVELLVDAVIAASGT